MMVMVAETVQTVLFEEPDRVESHSHCMSCHRPLRNRLSRIVGRGRVCLRRFQGKKTKAKAKAKEAAA